MFPFFLVPMDIAQQASVQVRAEERVRSSNDVDAEETELNPQLRYDAAWTRGQNHFTALYQPRLIHSYTFGRPTVDAAMVNPDTVNTRDPNDTPTSALHNVGLGLELLRPRWRLAAYQFAAYGPITTTSLLVQAPWSGDGLPADPNPIVPSTVAARFRLIFIQTQVTLPIRLNRRVSLTPTFAYNAFGGADRSSRAAMALTSGPGASVALEVAPAPNDRFVSTVGGGRLSTEFEGDRVGATIYRAEATQSWRHWHTRSVSTEVLGGGTIGGDAGNGFTLYSIAQTSVVYDTYPLPKYDPGAPPFGAPAGHGNRLQVALVAKATPWLDLFSGELEQRAVFVAAANLTLDRTTLRVMGSGARVFNTPHSVATFAVLQSEIGGRYRFTPTLSADVGGRFGYQEFSNAIRAGDLLQVVGFAAVLWAPVPQLF